MAQTPMTSQRRARPGRRLVPAIIGCCLTLSACQAPPPDVTFYGNRTAVQTAPTRTCELDEAAATIGCPDTNPDDLPRLPLRRGDSVQINVPAAIGDTPWWVYFRYLDAEGTLSDGRTEAFTDGRLAYTLRPFGTEDQLVSVEVQDNFVLVAGADGGVDFVPARGWQLLIEPAA